ncbi:unnamed protein product [Closterium sp. Yama58-4]|nr:unnamed protein product [Closterium sp. Yama58-4]
MQGIEGLLVKGMITRGQAQATEGRPLGAPSADFLALCHAQLDVMGTALRCCGAQPTRITLYLRTPESFLSGQIELFRVKEVISLESEGALVVALTKDSFLLGLLVLHRQLPPTPPSAAPAEPVTEEEDERWQESGAGGAMRDSPWGGRNGGVGARSSDEGGAGAGGGGGRRGGRGGRSERGVGAVGRLQQWVLRRPERRGEGEIGRRGVREDEVESTESKRRVQSEGGGWQEQGEGTRERGSGEVGGEQANGGQEGGAEVEWVQLKPYEDEEQRAAVGVSRSLAFAYVMEQFLQSVVLSRLKTGVCERAMLLLGSLLMLISPLLVMTHERATLLHPFLVAVLMRLLRILKCQMFRYHDVMPLVLRAWMMQQSLWQRTVTIDSLLDQMRAPLSALRTLGRMLMPQVAKTELGPDLVQGMVSQGDEIGDVLSQLQQALYPLPHPPGTPPATAAAATEGTLGTVGRGIAQPFPTTTSTTAATTAIPRQSILPPPPPHRTQLLLPPLADTELPMPPLLLPAPIAADPAALPHAPPTPLAAATPANPQALGSQSAALAPPQEASSQQLVLSSHATCSVHRVLLPLLDAAASLATACEIHFTVSYGSSNPRSGTGPAVGAPAEPAAEPATSLPATAALGLVPTGRENWVGNEENWENWIGKEEKGEAELGFTGSRSLDEELRGNGDEQGGLSGAVDGDGRLRWSGGSDADAGLGREDYASGMEDDDDAVYEAMLERYVVEGGGWVHVHWQRAPGGGVLLLVEDSGVGVHYLSASMAASTQNLPPGKLARAADALASMEVARGVAEVVGAVMRVQSPHLVNAPCGYGGTRVELWLAPAPVSIQQ